MPIEYRAGGSWRGSRVPRVRRGTAWGNVCDLFLPNLWGHTLAINRRTHSSPPASGDSDDRIDMALLNFEKDPAEVRAADPRELLARARGDFGDVRCAHIWPCLGVFIWRLAGRARREFLSAPRSRSHSHDFQVHVTRRARIGEIGDWSNAGHLEASIPAASQHPKPTSSHRVSVNPLPS